MALHMPKTNSNVGSALRCAYNYGAAAVITSGRRYKTAATDTPKAERHLPLFIMADVFDAIPKGAIPVAVELVEGAIPLDRYVHPESAVYIFGPEDGGLTDKILSRCRDVVYIPTNRCLNLAVTVGTVLYDRAVKRREWEATDDAR